jgi:opacity protein-like surface antigen
MRKYPTLLLFLLLIISNTLLAQSLENVLNRKLEETSSPAYTIATFKTGRIINGHSIENPEQGDLLFLVSHRFGTLNTGFYNFFGLDNSSTRLGLDYGITDRFCIGLGRATYQKTWDGYFKYKIIRQRSGNVPTPFTLSLVLAADINTLKSVDPEITYTLTNRMSYVTQVLIARKFGPKLSLQITPTYIHKNLVERRIDQNNIFAIGTGARFKISNRVSFNAEYNYLLPGQTANDYSDSFSIGFDIETGGHVFQLHLTNSQSVTERGFITETSGHWKDGDIRFGFNIIRVFGLQRKTNK